MSEPEKPIYTINVMSVADVHVPSAFLMFHNFDPKVYTVPTYMFLISGNGIPLTLVDTGVKEDTETLPKIFPEMQGVTPPKEEFSIVYQMAKFGYKPEDVQVLLHTHLHVDHAGNDHMFPNAKIIIARKEMMFSVAGVDKGYPAEYISYLVSQLDVPGRMRFYDDQMELFPGIEMEVVGGHTLGSSIIKVNTKEGVAYLCGDNIYNQVFQCKEYPGHKPDVAAQFNGPADKFGNALSGNNVDAWGAQAALQKIMREADLVLPSHDPYVLEVYGDTI